MSRNDQTTSRNSIRLAGTVAIGLLFLAVLGVLIWRVSVFTEQRELDQLRKTGQLRLTLYGTALRDTLNKYRHLPYILARDYRIRQLLHGHLTAKAVNPHLADFALAAEALIFVMNGSGEAVASSNWRTPQSLIGTNFSYRPYFQDALAGEAGAYYAFGAKTRKPGFFISYPVLETGRLLGVVAVKVDLEALQSSWVESQEAIMVSDSSGVIFLSSIDKWRYKSLRPLPEETARTLRQNQYLAQPLTDLKVVRALADGGNFLSLGETTYFEQSLQLPEYGWRIHYLTNLAAMHRNVNIFTIGAAVAAAAIVSIILYFRERRRTLFSRQATREAETFRELNTRLTEEIELHRQTEETLRQTQKELLRTGRLAAMGQMSAAIVHELNQPVTAIRTFLASARILVDRDQPMKVHENLRYIEQLTDRMAALTSQLKVFARDSKGRKDPIDLACVIGQTLSFFAPQLRQRNISIHCELLPEGQAVVAGDSRKLEQVLNNLIQNGMDAVKQRHNGQLTIRLQKTADQAVIVCEDNGDGVDEEIADYLFDPFFTTKETGEGLGLGLAISYGIIEDMNGSIRAQNRAGGGAVFAVYIPLINP